MLIPRLPELHRLLAGIIAFKPVPLNPEEFRFLRKHLGYSSSDFSKKLGVTPETISRWEGGKHAIDAPAEVATRLMVATSTPVERYPEEILNVERKATKRKSPGVLLAAPKRPTGAWAMAS